MFNTKDWGRVTEDTYGYPVETHSNKDFSLYYSHVKNKIGEYFVAPSFGDFVPINQEEIGTIDQWASNFRETPILVKVCCDFEPVMERFVVERSGFIHQIEFNSYSEWYENGVAYRFKRNIKKGRKNNLDVRIEKTKDSVRQFWEMHAWLRLKKFYEIPQPWTYFENIYNIFFKTGNGFTINAYTEENALIAGILVILNEGVAFYKFNASVLERLDIRANNYLLDRLIHYLSGINIKKLNLGYTGSSSSYEGLRTYKVTAGATEYMRFTLRTPSFNSLDQTMIDNINNEVQVLINSNPTLEKVDKFSSKYYKYFI